MKILQVIPYFCFGGAETMCENLIYSLRRLGHEVVVVSLYDEHTPISDRMEKEGVQIRYLDKKLGLDVSMVPKLTRIMRQEKPDVVHTHLDVVKYAALAAKLAGVKGCVHTVHSVAEKDAEGIARKLNRIYFHLGWAVPAALSPQIQQTILDTYRMTSAEVPVIFNGVDLTRCIPKESYRTGDMTTFVHIGRFDVPKNHKGMLEAFRKLLETHPQCRLQLVGDGDLREEMENYARELGIADYVQFAGFQSQVHPYLHNADVFILPSLYEGIPMTIIEAMGTGLPIVATTVGGIPDLLTDGEDALLVPCEPDAICHACTKLADSEELRQRLGRKALQNSVRFSSDQMARQYCELYQKTIKS